MPSVFSTATGSGLSDTRASAWLSVWDIVIFVLAILISAIQLGQKAIFLNSIHAGDVHLLQVLAVALVNIACYLAILTWAYLLLKKNKSVLLRIYVLVIGLLFTTLNRAVEGLEESTHQGVDFELVNHMLLALLGRDGNTENGLLFVFRYGLFFVLALGLLLKHLQNKGHTQGVSRPASVFFLITLLLSFVTPSSSGIPESLRANGLVHVVKTAWFPVADIRPEALSAFRLGKAESESRVEEARLQGAHNKDLAYFASAQGMNIAVIVLESTSANMLDFYPGNEAFPGTTPFMTAWSENSILVNETSAVMNSTSKSLVSIFCGIEPYLKTEVFEVTLGVPVDCLPERLSGRGYHTIYFQSATKFYEGRDQLVEHAGFDEFVSVDQLPEEERRGKQSIGALGLEDKVMLKAHQRWIDRQREAKKPFMAFYMTLAQHHPYLPMSYDDSFKNHAPDNRYMNDFVNSLTYVDQYLESVVEQYKEAGLYEDTVFYIVGDHGESFGRYHRPWFHNNVLYREGSWVPFFIVNEKLISERVNIDGEFSLMDVAPTIEYMHGIDISEEYRGYPVFQSTDERMLFSSCWYKNRCLSAVDKDYKYIFNYSDSEEELYARQEDFREQINLAQQYPDLLRQYRNRTFSWYHDIMSAYESYYYSLDNHYLANPESYYQFPSEILPDKSEVERW